MQTRTACVLALLLLAACARTDAYLDNGVRTHRFWPPLAAAPSTGSQAWALNPCTFNFNDVTGAGGDSDIGTAIELYKTLVFPSNACSSGEPSLSLPLFVSLFLRCSTLPLQRPS